MSPARPAAGGSPAEEILPAAPKPRRSARSNLPAGQPEQQAQPEQGAAQAPQPELAPDPGQGSGRTRELPAAPTTAQILDHPGHAPELLALAAVATIGPRARSWADRMRATYPAATADGLARLATRRFVRLARAGGAVAAVSGLLAPLAELSAVAGTQAGLVLHLAAAHGRDPGHPDRAAELLVLMQVQPDLDAAGNALDAARAAVDGGSGPPHRIAEAGWRLAAPLAAQTGGWLALRLAARLMPGAAVLAAAAGNSAAAERLAARAVAHYRGTAVGTG